MREYVDCLFEQIYFIHPKYTVLEAGRLDEELINMESSIREDKSEQSTTPKREYNIQTSKVGVQGEPSTSSVKQDDKNRHKGKPTINQYIYYTLYDINFEKRSRSIVS